MAGLDLRPPEIGTRKRFGQHFLADEGILAELVACIAPQPGEIIVEIGPGRGALTFRLLAQGATVHAIEIDRDLVAAFRRSSAHGERLIIHEADALKFDYDSLSHTGKPLRIVGNLPYNISTPLMLGLLQRGSQIGTMCFMLQKEVAERLVAAPGCAAYGRLSVMTQAYCQASIVLDVPPTAFIPPPRVDSSVIVLHPRGDIPCRFKDLESVVANTFAHRRKMLRHTLGKHFSAETLATLQIALTDRPENVSVAQYVALANLAR